MKEYAIYYTSKDGCENMVGSGRGKNEAEAIKDFYYWHNDCAKITSIELYK